MKRPFSDISFQAAWQVLFLIFFLFSSTSLFTSQAQEEKSIQIESSSTQVADIEETEDAVAVEPVVTVLHSSTDSLPYPSAKIGNLMRGFPLPLELPPKQILA